MNADASRNLRLLFLAALVNAGLFAAVLTVLTPGYESNDDVGMAHIVSGVTSGTPSEQIVFSNVLIGKLLKHLYETTDRVNWYALYLVGAHYLSMTGLLYAFLRTRAARSSVIFFGLLFVQFEVALLLFLQFTSTGVMAGVAGLLLILSSNCEEAGRSWLASAYGGALVVLSGLIRPDSLYYALVLLLPLLAYEFCGPQTWGDWKTWAKRLARQASPHATLLGDALRQTGRAGQIAVFFAVALVAIAYNGWHYRADPRWREFLQYTVVRAAIHDLPIVEYSDNTRFFFDRIGWSLNDWGMFRSWFFSNGELFSREKMQTILDRFQGGSWGRPSPGRYLHETLRRFTVFPAMMWANLALAILLCRGRRARALLIVAAQALLFEILIFAFSHYAKLALRLVFPAYFAASAVAFFVVLRAESEQRWTLPSPAPGWARWLLVAVAAAFGPFYALRSVQTVERLLAQSASNRRDQHAYGVVVRTLYDRYAAADRNAVFFNWGGVFPLEHLPPFDNLRQTRQLRMLGLGWNTHSPPFDDAVRRWQLGDLYRATFENPSVYLLSVLPHLKGLERYVHEHYQKQIHVSKNVAYLVDGDFPPVQGYYGVSVFQMSLGASPEGLDDRKLADAARPLSPGKSP